MPPNELFWRGGHDFVLSKFANVGNRRVLITDLCFTQFITLKYPMSVFSSSLIQLMLSPPSLGGNDDLHDSWLRIKQLPPQRAFQFAPCNKYTHWVVHRASQGLPPPEWSSERPRPSPEWLQRFPTFANFSSTKSCPPRQSNSFGALWWSFRVFDGSKNWGRPYLTALQSTTPTDKYQKSYSKIPLGVFFS